ncbi:MAG: conjugal transfer protein TraG N-terminal domain-containing protein, partial [Ottowia sp.]|nr:conjugal transfer protein TraG N-terminal domain-containing protein [Ottowia sp.]
MHTLTIYTVNADVTLLSAILNGVAMICKQHAMIWSFALLVSLWKIVSALTSTALTASSGGAAGAVLAKGSTNMVMPLIFAFLLTSTGLQSTIQVQSTINGRVTSVDNVPFVISAIPAAASLMAQEVGGVVETAFQSVGTDYPSISASGNGFINPLKVLLTSRTAVLRLGGIDSEVRTVLSTCLGSDSGVDYGAVTAKVMNAGNTGATAAQTIEIAGTHGTALGALLYQAAQNKVGLVPEIVVDSQTILSCADAAQVVADNITSALNSKEFTRVVQGAVNGMDQPIAGADYSLATLTQQYTAMRTANTTMSALAGGAMQANAEVLNLLFAELTANALNCLKADASNKTTCQAAAIQANEIERNNIHRASNEVPMLKYAGSFANYILALIIGLGPVIVMFMMFAGVDAGKNIKTAVHIMVWPLLVMNVGAELINGMIHISVANFLTSITQGGYLSQAVAIEAYKELSLQVGTASHIMASLPVIMSMIFALGGSAAMVSVANNLNPKEKNTVDAVSPSVMSATPLISQGSMAQLAHGNGWSNLKQTGALPSAASSATHASLANEASSTLINTVQKQKTISEGEQNLAAWKKAFDGRDYSHLGVDQRTGDSVRSAWMENQKANALWTSGNSVGADKTNQNTTGASAQVGFSSGSGKGLLGFSAGVSAKTGASATDSMKAGTSTGKTRTIDESASLEKAVSTELSNAKINNKGSDTAKALSKTLDTQRSFQKTLSSTESTSDATSELMKNSSGFVAYQAGMKPEEFAHQSQANSNYRMFQITDGEKFESMPAAQPHLQKAAKAMQDGSTDGIVGNKNAQQAIQRHSAAVRLAQDESAKPEDRQKALEYLVHESAAMTGLNVKAGDTSMRKLNIGDPTDKVGINAEALQKQVEKRNPGSSNQPKSAAQRSAVSRPARQPAINTAEQFKDEITQRFSNGVKEDVADAQRQADKARIGKNADGTLLRTM